MSTLLIVGRIAVVLIFVISGALKLIDIPGTAAVIAAKVPVPALLAGLVAQIEAAAGMKAPQLMAIATGVIELGGGLLIAANFGTRWAALALLLLTAAATFYFHDFWNVADAARMENLIHAEKNLSIMGALLMLFVLGSYRLAADDNADRIYERLNRDDTGSPTA
jgi:uncharacterized membrane protein YphA (DoxX/SURF4 family)